MSAALELLHEGTVIPAHPLALTDAGELDEERQRGLTRYYAEAGAGGIAVGVHTTQFAIRQAGLLAPVLRLAAETASEFAGARPFVLVAGASGPTAQAVAEAELAQSLGYDAVLASVDGLGHWSEEALLDRARALAGVLPVIGFYLQPAVGGRRRSPRFWRALADVEGVAAIKIAPFNRYQTVDVVRAVAHSDRRDEVALYTGNDDNYLVDLLTPFRVRVGRETVELRIVGGLLGQWAVWTGAAVRLLAEVKRLRPAGAIPVDLLARQAALTDQNAAVFDVANGFAGCIAGVHEVLRRDGLLAGIRCLDPCEGLSPGQSEELTRVAAEHPELTDGAPARVAA
jgi:hypothetical protein